VHGQDQSISCKLKALQMQHVIGALRHRLCVLWLLHGAPSHKGQTPE
jgi:hypothetical protein